MPTSGETSFEWTAGDLIKSAMVELGVLSLGDEPDSDEYAEAVRRLNGFLKYLATKGAMFRDSTGTVTITGGTGAATLDSAIRDVSSVRHVVSATNYRQLMPWNRSQYYAMPNRAAVGNPSIYFINKTTTGNEIRIWPVPAADITLHIDYSRGAEVVTAPDETLDVPEDWHDAMLYNLASRLASMFGADRIDTVKLQRVERSAAETLNAMLDADRPDSYFMHPWNGYCA